MKAILIGNGFTSQYISAYKNENLLKSFRNSKKGNMYFERIDKCFEQFRNNSIDRADIFIHPESYCGEGYCGEFYCTSPTIRYNESIKNEILKTMEANNFDVKKYEEYFETYGLIYKTIKGEILDIESMLKIVDLFSDTKLFEKHEREDIITIANSVMYNFGNIGEESVDNPRYSDKVKEDIRTWINEYDYVFTTNYDDLLDNIYTKEVFHLHGGFHYSIDKRPIFTPLNRKRLLPEEAFIVWGKNSEEKLFKTQRHFWNIEFSKFSFLTQTIFDVYREKLEKDNIEEIHIYGYSGDNDGHINTLIANNNNIKSICYFYYPEDVNKEKVTLELKKKFEIKSNCKKLELVSSKVISDRIFN